MLNNIKVLELFKNRQVVLNRYESEELVNKEGFAFESIIINSEKINFIINGKVIHSIDISLFSAFKELDDFHNYYELTNKNTKMEIYFP